MTHQTWKFVKAIYRPVFADPITVIKVLTIHACKLNNPLLKGHLSKPVNLITRDLPIMLKTLPIMLCYAALLKNLAYYAQIMFTNVEQFPDTISMHCL